MKKRSYPEMRTQSTGRDEDAFMRAELATLRRFLASPRALTRTGNRGDGRPAMMAGKRKAATKPAAAPAPAPEPELTHHTPGWYNQRVQKNPFGQDFRLPLPTIVRDVDPRSREGISAAFHQLMNNWNTFKAVGAARVSPKAVSKMNAAFRTEAVWLQQALSAAM